VVSFAVESLEVEHRVEEFRALAECLSGFIGRLESNGSDVVSAKIIHESLYLSLSLYIEEQNRIRCNIEQADNLLALLASRAKLYGKSLQPQSVAALAPQSVVAIFPYVARTQGPAPMPANKEVKGQLALVPTGPDFRPLTKDQQKVFVSSMNDECRNILTRLMGEKSSEPAALARRETRPALTLLQNPSARIA